jgi:hypothetical protein
MNIKLTSEYDLDLSSGNLEMITGSDEIAQKLAVRFQFFLGDWFLDQSLGVPYYQDVLVKNPDFLVLQSHFREVILETPGVASLVGELGFTFDSAARILTLTFSAQLENGEPLDFNRELKIGD